MGWQLGMRALSYIRPMILMAIALYGAVLTILQIIFVKRRPQDLLNSGLLKDRTFGKLWLTIGPTLAKDDEETAIPALIGSTCGTILELGPGIGSQLPRYTATQITKIYGVEPNKDLHPAIRTAIKEAGLSDIYTLVPCAIEDQEKLREYGIENESIDTVISIQVLCSLPAPGETAKALYGFLKPGGRMVVYEHVRSTDFVSGIVQRLYNPIWSPLTGNCHLNRQTQQTLLAAGDWDSEKTDLTLPSAEDAWALFPRISGSLTKRSAL